MIITCNFYRSFNVFSTNVRISFNLSQQDPVDNSTLYWTLIWGRYSVIIIIIIIIIIIMSNWPQIYTISFQHDDKDKRRLKCCVNEHHRQAHPSDLLQFQTISLLRSDHSANETGCF